MNYMDADRYMQQWRFRINLLRVFFLDAYGKVIPNIGERAADFFGMEVIYPNYFYDLDKNKVPHMFAAYRFLCRSIYKNIGDDVFMEDCTVAKEFDFDRNIFASSPNGIFTMNLFNSEKLNMTRFQKLRIEISGTLVPFSQNTTTTKSPETVKKP